MCENLEEASFSVKPRALRPKDARRRLIRQKLFQECGGICPYCGIKMFLPCKDKDGVVKTFPDTATIDHIIPVSKNGSNLQSNLLVCCGDCNSKKGNASLFEIMRAKMKSANRIAKRDEYLEIERNLRLRASVWFNLEPI